MTKMQNSTTNTANKLFSALLSAYEGHSPIPMNKDYLARAYAHYKGAFHQVVLRNIANNPQMVFNAIHALQDVVLTDPSFGSRLIQAFDASDKKNIQFNPNAPLEELQESLNKLERKLENLSERSNKALNTLFIASHVSAVQIALKAVDKQTWSQSLHKMPTTSALLQTTASLTSEDFFSRGMHLVFMEVEPEIYGALNAEAVADSNAGFKAQKAERQRLVLGYQLTSLQKLIQQKTEEALKEEEENRKKEEAERKERAEQKRIAEEKEAERKRIEAEKQAKRDAEEAEKKRIRDIEEAKRKAAEAEKARLKAEEEARIEAKRKAEENKRLQEQARREAQEQREREEAEREKLEIANRERTAAEKRAKREKARLQAIEEAQRERAISGISAEELAAIKERAAKKAANKFKRTPADEEKKAKSPRYRRQEKTTPQINTEETPDIQETAGDTSQPQATETQVKLKQQPATTIPEIIEAEIEVENVARPTEVLVPEIIEASAPDDTEFSDDINIHDVVTGAALFVTDTPENEQSNGKKRKRKRKKRNKTAAEGQETATNTLNPRAEELLVQQAFKRTIATPQKQPNPSSNFDFLPEKHSFSEPKTQSDMPDEVVSEIMKKLPENTQLNSKEVANILNVAQDIIKNEKPSNSGHFLSKDNPLTQKKKMTLQTINLSSK